MSEELSAANSGPQQCFAGLLAYAFGAAAQLLASLHHTVKKHSLQATRRQDVRDLTGDACCCGLSYEERRVHCRLRLKDDLLIAKPLDLAEEQEVVQLVGAEVECQGVVVSLTRNLLPYFQMAFESERLAGLWATKVAVACGSSESISKLFSTQRRRIHALELRSVEAQQSNEEVERCLNFLSREYVEMRYQVRRAGPLDSTREVQELGEKEDDEPLLIEDIDPPKFPSEPEKEPLNSARTDAKLQEITEDPATAPCLLGSPSHLPKRKEKKLPLKEPREEKPREEVSSPRRRKKEPLWSPKALSSYDRSSELDRRGHKLAMAHQRQRPQVGGATRRSPQAKTEKSVGSDGRRC